MNRRQVAKHVLLPAILCFITPFASAQVLASGGSPEGDCNESHFGDHSHGPLHGPDFGGEPGSPRRDGTSSTMRGGLQLGPPGRWWDDPCFAKNLGLRSDQKDKMDAIFNANKGAILQSYQSLQQEEAQMGDAARQTQVDETTIFAAIDRVAQARAALEKANAHMLLLIRKNMDQGQLERLEQHRHH